MTRRELALLLAILLLAAVVRLARPDLTEFKADEGRLLTAALTMSDGQFALRGISSSVGLPNAPMSVWLYALPLVVWSHPYAATLFTGLLGVVAVGGVYWLARRYWGIGAAVCAATMLAVSPWAIVFSRKIWAQNLLPAFVVGWAIAAVLTYVERRRAFLILHILCLAIAVQIHPGAISLVPATLLFLIVFRRRVDWRYLAAGVLLSALTAVPFLWYLWSRFRADGGLAMASGQSSPHFSFDAVSLISDILSGQGIAALADPNYNGFPAESAIRLLWLALVVAGAGWAVWKIARTPREPAAQTAFICLVWLLAPVAVFLWQWTPPYIHYFILAIPAAFLLAGGVWGEMASRVRPPVKVVAWSAFVVVSALQLAIWANMMAVVARDPMAGGFGIPLGVKLAAADGARRLLDETEAIEILVAGDGANPEQQDFPAEFRALLHGVPLRYVDLKQEAVFPATPSVVLLDTSAADGPSSARDLYLVPSGEWDSFAIPGGDLAYSVRAMPAAATPSIVSNIEPPPLLANFVRLIGYDDRRLLGEGVWDIYWRPADNPDAGDYHFFNHLLDGAGRRVAQVDGAAFAGPQWRAGDVVISRFWLAVPNELDPPPAMSIGMYRFPSIESVPILDEAANPAGDAVTIPLGD